jgi:hypothetical protein
LKFRFPPRYSNDGSTYVRIVKVVLTIPKSGTSISVQCRIDSGADEIMLPGEVGVIVGLKLEEGKRLEFQGIAHDSGDGYRHSADMQIKNDTRTYKVRFQ